ncbi:hypothetical protein K439DRAFT_280068 [Ramaria rubella]|nr:hypothetical protein K439DRAFT_280068 [Ramaria rubella]
MARKKTHHRHRHTQGPRPTTKAHSYLRARPPPPQNIPSPPHASSFLFSKDSPNSTFPRLPSPVSASTQTLPPPRLDHRTHPLSSLLNAISPQFRFQSSHPRCISQAQAPLTIRSTFLILTTLHDERVSVR